MRENRHGSAIMFLQVVRFERAVNRGCDSHQALPGDAFVRAPPDDYTLLQVTRSASLFARREKLSKVPGPLMVGR